MAGRPGGGNGVRERMRLDLRTALRARDAAAVAALRSALGALDNAEAVDPSAVAAPELGTAPTAGAALGVGATEAARRVLDDADVARLLQAEIDEREQAAATFERAGRPDQAERLRGEAGVLAAYLD
jgi:uncharacterized protein YqeY